MSDNKRQPSTTKLLRLTIVYDQPVDPECSLCGGSGILDSEDRGPCACTARIIHVDEIEVNSTRELDTN